MALKVDGVAVESIKLDSPHKGMDTYLYVDATGNVRVHRELNADATSTAASSEVQPYPPPF